MQMGPRATAKILCMQDGPTVQSTSGLNRGDPASPRCIRRQRSDFRPDG